VLHQGCDGNGLAPNEGSGAGVSEQEGQGMELVKGQAGSGVMGGGELGGRVGRAFPVVSSLRLPVNQIDEKMDRKSCCRL